MKTDMTLVQDHPSRPKPPNTQDSYTTRYGPLFLLTVVALLWPTSTHIISLYDEASTSKGRLVGKASTTVGKGNINLP